VSLRGRLDEEPDTWLAAAEITAEFGTVAPGVAVGTGATSGPVADGAVIVETAAVAGENTARLLVAGWNGAAAGTDVPEEFCTDIDTAVVAGDSATESDAESGCSKTTLSVAAPGRTATASSSPEAKAATPNWYSFPFEEGSACTH
jgi:hypothetical protein